MSYNFALCYNRKKHVVSLSKTTCAMAINAKPFIWTERFVASVNGIAEFPDTD